MGVGIGRIVNGRDSNAEALRSRRVTAAISSTAIVLQHESDERGSIGIWGRGVGERSRGADHRAARKEEGIAVAHH